MAALTYSKVAPVTSTNAANDVATFRTFSPDDGKHGSTSGHVRDRQNPVYLAKLHAGITTSNLNQDEPACVS